MIVKQKQNTAGSQHKFGFKQKVGDLENRLHTSIQLNPQAKTIHTYFLQGLLLPGLLLTGLLLQGLLLPVLLLPGLLLPGLLLPGLLLPGLLLPGLVCRCVGSSVCLCVGVSACRCAWSGLVSSGPLSPLSPKPFKP